MEIARLAGYGSDLGQTGPFTVFAPTIEAFAAMDPDDLARLRADRGAADELLRDLIVDEAIRGSELVPGPLRAIGGGTIVIAESAHRHDGRWRPGVRRRPRGIQRDRPRPRRRPGVTSGRPRLPPRRHRRVPMLP